MKIRIVIGLVALLASSGCAMEQKKVEKEVAAEESAPINCATAQGDLRVLQSEKANLAERMAEGVTAIYPAGLVLGVLTGTEGTKLKVAAGDYNQMIDKRIAEIQQQCGME